VAGTGKGKPTKKEKGLNGIWRRVHPWPWRWMPGKLSMPFFTSFTYAFGKIWY
jgi:hypothetical protein